MKRNLLPSFGFLFRALAPTLIAALIGTSTVAASAADTVPATKPSNTRSKPQAGVHPDFSGVWRHDFKFPGDKQFYLMVPEDFSFMLPWAREEVERRQASMKAGRQIPNNGLLCRPPGIPSFLQEAHDLQIIQLPDQLVFLAETDHEIRYVRLNEKIHPVNLLPSWNGHSIAHWEGDTLVIDTVGLSTESQVDPWGTPHSPAMHVTERMRLQKNGSMLETIITVEDHLAFKKPWTYSYHYEKANDLEFIGEYACAENNQDSNLDLLK